MCACEACTSASSPCIDVVSGPVNMHVVSFCVLHDLSLVPGTISAASPLATPTPIGGRMPSVASGPCGVSVSFIRVNLSWFIVPFELFGRWLCVRVAIPPSKIECWFCRVVYVYWLLALLFPEDCDCRTRFVWSGPAMIVGVLACASSVASSIFSAFCRTGLKTCLKNTKDKTDTSPDFPAARLQPLAFLFLWDTGVGLGRVNHVCVCYRVLGTAS